MKRIAVLVFALGCVGIARAQQPPLAIQCHPEQSPYDAVTAAPEQHKVLFEDDHVRVLQITLPPHTQEPVHVHALPSIIEGETGGAGGARFAYIEYRFQDGKFIETGRHEVSPVPGYRKVQTGPEGPHAIANLSNVPVSFKRTEIKPEGCAAKAGF
jgi:hypothetical protein